MSFILLNVPDNATLNASHPDSDDDFLSDWTELYVTFTNPFITDTDDDGISYLLVGAEGNSGRPEAVLYRAAFCTSQPTFIGDRVIDITE